VDDDEWSSKVYRAYFNDVYRYIKRRAPDLDVENLVENVFQTSYERRRRIPTDNILPWLYKVAWLKLLNEFRKAERHPEVIRPVDELDGSSESADHSHDVVTRETFEQAIKQLPIAEQELLRLLLWEQLSPPEIAMVLGQRRTAILMRIKRLREKLLEAGRGEVSRRPYLALWEWLKRGPL